MLSIYMRLGSEPRISKYSRCASYLVMNLWKASICEKILCYQNENRLHQNCNFIQCDYLLHVCTLLGFQIEFFFISISKVRSAQVVSGKTHSSLLYRNSFENHYKFERFCIWTSASVAGTLRSKLRNKLHYQSILRDRRLSQFSTSELCSHFIQTFNNFYQNHSFKVEVANNSSFFLWVKGFMW